MVDHIHLDKQYIQHTLPKGATCSSLLIIHFDSDCVHIYANNLISIHNSHGLVAFSFLLGFTHTQGHSR
jgi:hypothetical protein